MVFHAGLLLCLIDVSKYLQSIGDKGKSDTTCFFISGVISFDIEIYICYKSEPVVMYDNKV